VPQESAAPQSAPSYSFRLSVFSKEQTYRLQPDALVWTDGKTSRRVRYADVRRIHIVSMPPAMGRTLRRTVLRGRFRGRIIIGATHFLGLGRFVDRSDSYFPFAEALIARIVAANPGVFIWAGHGWANYLFWAAMFGLSVVFLAGGVIALLAGGLEAKTLPVFAILVAFLPVSWRILRNGRPRKADPSALYTRDLG
jgi:hypothetical protein